MTLVVGFWLVAVLAVMVALAAVAAIALALYTVGGIVVKTVKLLRSRE